MSVSSEDMFDFVSAICGFDNTRNAVLAGEDLAKALATVAHLAETEKMIEFNRAHKPDVRAQGFTGSFGEYN